GADHRDTRARIGHDLQRGRRETREEVERHEARVAHRVLDVVAEDPEEPEVAQEVEPAAVEEHRGERRVPGALLLEDAGDPTSERHARSRIRETEPLARDEPELAERRVEGLALPGP